MAEIAAEFGGSTPHSLSEYYSATGGIPGSGSIDMGVFRGKSGGTINQVGYEENKYTSAANTNGNYYADMPSLASGSSNLTLVAIWHDSATYTTTINAASGWTRLISNARGRPYMAVFAAYGAKTGSQLVATGPSGVGVNIQTVQFTSNKGNTSSAYQYPYLVDQWHVGNACWNDVGPSGTDVSGNVNEYYMVFFTSGRPISDSQTVTSNGNAVTELLNGVAAPSTNFTRASTFISNKLYGYNGDPGNWSMCMNFSNRGSYAWVAVGTW